MPGRTLIIGTRGSALAIEQARRVRVGLDGESEVRVVHTSGDRLTEAPLGERNPVGFFTKEIEEELLGRRIDLAVHSLKDLPTQLASGLTLAALLRRDEPCDVLLVRPEAHDRAKLLPVKNGARVGASSARRTALLGMVRADLKAIPIRGNVTTRIEKVRRGDFDAILLSAAGLERLHLDVCPLVAYVLNPRRWPGAPGQSIIAVETRQDDAEASHRTAPLDDRCTRARAEAERSLLRTFGGGCHAPFGAYSEVSDNQAEIFVAAPCADGSFGVVRFVGETLDAARQEAEVWILAGLRPREVQEEQEWLCRPAPSWC